MTHKLDTIVLGNTEHPRKLVVVLHGLGSYNEHIQPFAERVAAAMPDALVLVPNAPLPRPCPPEKAAKIREKDPAFQPEKARTWFETSMTSWPMLSLRIIFNTLPFTGLLNALIDETLAHYGLKDKDLAFFGFSQGGAAALYTAIRREKPCACVVAHSAMYLGLAQPVSRPDVLMIAGDADDTIYRNTSWVAPMFLFGHGVSRLEDIGLQVTQHICHGLAHEISRESGDKSISFMIEALERGGNSPLPAPPAHPRP